MNDLIAPTSPSDRTGWTNLDSVSSATNGLKMLDPAVDAGDALMRGDFVEAGVNGVSAALDVVGMVFNPLAGVVSMVANWAMEHCGPLQDWLDQLLGDPAVIRASAQTWVNVGDHLGAVSQEFLDAVDRDMKAYYGLTVDAYRGYAAVQSAMMTGLSKISYGVSAAIELAGGILAGVRDFIQGTFSDLVGAAVDAAAKAVFTAGIAAPACLAGLIARARSIIERCRAFMRALSTSLSKMADLMGDIAPRMETATRFVARIANDGLTAPAEYAVTFGVSAGKGLAGVDDPG